MVVRREHWGNRMALQPVGHGRTHGDARIAMNDEASRGRVTRRGFLRLMLAGAAGAGIVASTPVPAAAEESSATDYPNQLKIAILSDIHYFSESLWSDCPDFTLAENSDRKMFKESGSILDKALDDVVAYAPELILISGDLTKDGELVCHQEVHDRLAAVQKRLADAGTATRVFVINGNHDINNNANGMDFSSGTAVPAGSVDPNGFKDIYDFTYAADDVTQFAPGSTDGGSLSYVVRPAKGVTLIVVDSGKYSADQTASGKAEHETSGMVGEALLCWVQDQARQARAAGDVVLVMQHHGIVPHFGMEPDVLGEYLVDDYEGVAAAYAAAGVSAVLTGHMHANDVAAATYDGATIYDVETCATVTYPSDIRYATLGWTRDASDGATVSCAMDFESHALGEVALTGFDFAGGTASDITAYGNDHLLTTDVVKTMVGDIAVPALLAQVQAAGGIKPTMAGLLKVSPDQLDATLFGMAAALLPTSRDEAMVVDFSTLSAFLQSYGSAAIWYDANTARVRIERIPDEQGSGANAVALPITLSADGHSTLADAAASTPTTMSASDYSLYVDASTFSTFVADVYKNIDEKVIADAASVTAVAKELVDALLSQKVNGDHTVFDLIKYAYADHLRGDETCDEWAESAIAGTLADGSASGDGSVIGYVRAALGSVLAGDGTADSDLMALLKKVSFTLTKLVASADGSDDRGPFTLIGLVVNNVGQVVGYLGDDPASLIPNIPDVAAPVHGVLYTMTHDDNVATDRSFATQATAKDPDYRPAAPATPGDNAGSGDSSAGGGSGDSSADSGSGGGNAGGSGSLPKTGDDSLATVGAVAAAGVGVIATGLAARKLRS